MIAKTITKDAIYNYIQEILIHKNKLNIMQDFFT